MIHDVPRMVDQTSLRWRVFRVVLAVSTIATLLFHVSGVAATDNLNRPWISLPSGCYDHFVKYTNDSTVPTGIFRDRISDGRFLWNNVTRELWFSSVANGTADIRVYVYYVQPGWPNEDKLALTVLNAFPWWEVDNATLNINPIYDAVWYKGSGLPVPADKYDLYSVAGHEFGHMVALNHSTGAGDIMQATFATGEQRRTLTTHDKSGIKAYYPALTC